MGGGEPLGSTPLPTCLRVVYFTKCVCYLGDGKFIATLWAACQPYIRCRRWAVVVGWVYRVPTEVDRLLYLGRLDTYLPSRVYMHTHRRTPVGMGLL